jgi:hypothetical protein
MVLSGRARGQCAKRLRSMGGLDVTGAAGPIRKLHKAEKSLEIPHVRGRGYHALKRAHVSAAYELTGGDESRVQDLTGTSTVAVLRRHYRMAGKEATERQLDRVRARSSRGGHTVAIPRKSEGA